VDVAGHHATKGFVRLGTDCDECVG
jgi:hypothetical protein